MAPEHPPELVIFDSRFEEGKLKGDLHYIEIPIGERLRVAWEAEHQPENFQPVCGGVAFVFRAEHVSQLHVTHNAVPDDLGNLRYRWSEGLNQGIPWMMFVLVLPAGFTLRNPAPVPARAKLFKGRLALYWILKGDDCGRTTVACTLKEFAGDPYANLVQLNQMCSQESFPSNNFIQIEHDVRGAGPRLAGNSRAKLAEGQRTPVKRPFDVFLSHNSTDKPTVRLLAEELRNRGLRVWLDEWELIPGRPWQEALEEIIRTTKSAAVLVGADGLGPWEMPEMRACLSEFVKRRLPVIPLLLPGAPRQPELPLFLLQFT